MRNLRMLFGFLAVSLGMATLAACENGAAGIAASKSAAVTVRMDFQHRPLPEIPLPNDIATRWDANSATHRRINASMIAPSSFERITRQKIDDLDGWGVYQPISIPFTGLVDLPGIISAQWNDDYAFENDVVYVIDITKGSPTYGHPAALDVGNGNFPVTLKDLNGYWENDARGNTLSLQFEEENEDKNGNGKLDEGEDTDLDGLLDVPNYLPGKAPNQPDLESRSRALMYFYERETNTLILRPMRPLRERTTYAVVVTRRLKDAGGQPVGSPYPFVNHAAQTEALAPLVELLGKKPTELGGLGVDDVAFAWTFTTGSIYTDITAVRDGLYGHGVQKHLATEYPPDMAVLHAVYDKLVDDSGAKVGPNLYVISGERMVQLLSILGMQIKELGMDPKTVFGQRAIESLKYVDYHVIGSYNTPMLFPRKDAAGHYLSYNEMTWPPDMDRIAAPANPELVTFWMAVPRKEVSPRKDGKPAGLAIIGHGYTGSKLTTAQFAGYFARHGMASLCIDDVSHGIDIGESDMEIAKTVLDGLGYPGILAALMNNRSWDQDLDGRQDPGADFWTAYFFHTRDVVRQSLIDYMQLIRIFRAFDGKRTWNFDSNGDGKTDASDIAGDFDGDGVIDVGGKDSVIGMTGSSLGGMMSAMLGGFEPQASAVIPVCAGGGLTDVGVRSLQGGVREAVMLRVMGPLYIGYPENGAITVKAVVPHLNGTGREPVATMAAMAPGDTVLAENLSNGEYDCAVIRQGGSFRVGLASDVLRLDREGLPPQQHRLTFYTGNAFQVGVRDEEKGKACKLKPGVKPVQTIDKFGVDVNYHFQSEHLNFKKGDALSPIAEGMGLHRARPELRRMMGFGQMVADPADPAVAMVRALSGEQKYATGEVVNTHTVVISTIGDMNVPASTGTSIARAAGWLDFKTKHAEWNNRTANQVLIDNWVLEAVDLMKHFVTPAGDGVLFDPEDLSGSATLTATGTETPYPLGYDGYWAPRLSTPMHKFAIKDDGKGGISGGFWPYVRPTGKHDLDFPGEQTDRILAQCKDPANAKEPLCVRAAKGDIFDHGALALEGMVKFLQSGGKVWELKDCQNTWTCGDVPPVPPARE